MRRFCGLYLITMQSTSALAFVLCIDTRCPPGALLLQLNCVQEKSNSINKKNILTENQERIISYFLLSFLSHTDTYLSCSEVERIPKVFDTA